MIPFTFLLAFFASACGLGGPRSRYVVMVDSGSRYNFRYVKDRPSGQWVHLHCEMRVSEQRLLPNPIHSQELGDLVSFTYLGPGHMGSAGIAPAAFERRDGYRVWLWREVALPENLQGGTALSVQAKWPPSAKGPPVSETMELFHLPPLESLLPYVWSPWRKADELGGGAFAGWEKLQGIGAGTGPDGKPVLLEKASLPAFPYEMRCRVVLAESLVVPIEAEDSNIGRPDPSAAKQPPRPPSGPGNQP